MLKYYQEYLGDVDDISNVGMEDPDDVSGVGMDVVDDISGGGTEKLL